MILHISNDYSGSTVYMNLIRELDALAISQIVYNPIREVSRIGKNAVTLNQKGSEIIYRSILNYHIDRVFYPWKVYKTLKDIQKQVDFSKIKYIHAHTWYSDGGVAYELSKKYNIPYIVGVRSTDLNLFQKKLKYLHTYGRKILTHADKVILISASYKERVLNQKSLQSIRKSLEDKIEVIPNGIDPYWLNNITEKQLPNTLASKFIYIGNFNKGKNVLNLMRAIIKLNEKGTACTLDLVGGGGTDEQEILKLIKKHQDLFINHGKVYDKEELKNLYRAADAFAMPSRNETFGLVYVEAMTQGLPVLYTAKEGVDGFYTDKIGEKVSKGANLQEIANALEKMIKNYDSYKIPIKGIKQNHDWSLIAMRYKEIYGM